MVFSRSSPFVSSSGNFVFLVYGVRWFSTPLRLETMRSHRLSQVPRLSLFPLSPSPGQKFTVAGNSTISTGSCCAITRHPQTWTHILLVRACSDVAAPFVSPSSIVLSSLLSPTRSSLLSTGTSSQPSGPSEGPLTPSASRVVGDGNGASRPPVAGSAEFPGFALYQSVLLIVSPFFLNGVLFKSRSRSVTVVTLKGSVSTALGAR